MNFKSMVSKGLSVLLSEFFVVSVICALEYAYFHSYDLSSIKFLMVSTVFFYFLTKIVVLLLTKAIKSIHNIIPTDILLCALLIAFSYLYMHTEYYSSKVWSFVTTTLPIPYNRILYDLYKYLQVRFYFVLLLFVYTVPVLTGCILLFHLFKHLSHLYLFVSTFLKNMFNEKGKESHIQVKEKED